MEENKPINNIPDAPRLTPSPTKQLQEIKKLELPPPVITSTVVEDHINERVFRCIKKDDTESIV